MKRKFIGLMCVLAVTTSFIACGENKKESSSSKAESTENVESEDKNDEKESGEDKSDNKKEKEEKKQSDDEKKSEEGSKEANGNNPIEKFGFDIKMPKGWNPLPKEEVDKIAGPALKDFMLGMWAEHPTSGPNFAMMINENESIASLEVYKELMEAVIPASGNASEPVLEIKENNGIDVLNIDFIEFNAPRKKFQKVSQRIVKKDKGFVVITLTDDTEKNDGREDFEAMIDTLKEI